ncbi:MAG: carbohydrate binding domain-containing protein [Candidatus Omnitrophota bacterium]|nr:carbohydrate binding domain-containing protein [Candidatus Omnitrophota bacterium]
MKKIFLVIALFFGAMGISFAAAENLLVDDFEISVSSGPNGTVDFGAGNGSTVNVTAAAEVKNTGKQALKVDFDAVTGGYMYVARGEGLDAHNTGWLVSPEDIKWHDYKAFSFYMYGSDSKGKVAFDIKDNANEVWRFIVEDNFEGWRQIICNFEQFTARGDWQPQNADNNAVLNFPVRSFQFEPLPPLKGTIYLDTVELVKK